MGSDAFLFSNKKPKEEEKKGGRGGPAFLGFVPHVFAVSSFFAFLKYILRKKIPSLIQIV
jgi:hypothetical protein